MDAIGISHIGLFCKSDRNVEISTTGFPNQSIQLIIERSVNL